MKADAMKMQVKGQRFEGITEIQAKLKAMLDSLMTWKFWQWRRDAGPSV